MKYGPLNVCSCGDNHDAFDAALRLAKQNIKKRANLQDRDCALWHLAVANAYMRIVEHYVLAGFGALEATKERTLGEVIGLANEVRQESFRKVTAALFENTGLNAEISHFLCEELALPVRADVQDYLKAGPSEAVMAELGVVVGNSDEELGIEAILDILFKRKTN